MKVWWTICEPALLAMLREVEAGASADEVYAEYYVNATVARL